jgi:hypothetical protein
MRNIYILLEKRLREVMDDWSLDLLQYLLTASSFLLPNPTGNSQTKNNFYNLTYYTYITLKKRKVK